MLSKENYDKLNTTYLYKTTPIDKGNFTDTYWCKNWTFKVKKRNDGRAIMLDTYFESYDSHSVEVTDKNIDQFEVIFDFNDVKRISDYEAEEYAKEDKFRVATDSGGYNCGKLHWVKKDAQKSKRLLIEKAKQEVASAECSLSWAKSKLQRLLEE